MEVKPESELKKNYYFDRAKILNKGGFGSVSMIERRSTRELFALKTQDKGVDAVRDKNIKREKLALETLDHPNILKLREVYEGDLFVYFVLDLMTDLDLYEWSCKMYSGLRIDNVIYYTAELVLALEYLRTKGFIHRDMKAKNILLNLMGHIKLADFGVARKITDREGRLIVAEREVHNSVVGTHRYCSPEVQNKDVVTYSVDLWGLAVCISEMYCGEWVCRPLDKSEIMRRWLRRVHQGTYKYPWPDPDPDVKDIITKLTRIEPALRLGVTSLDQVKQHPLLRTINWDTLPTSHPPPLPPVRNYEKKPPKAKLRANPAPYYYPSPYGFFSRPPDKHPLDETPTNVNPEDHRSAAMKIALMQIEMPPSPARVGRTNTPFSHAHRGPSVFPFRLQKSPPPPRAPQLASPAPVVQPSTSRTSHHTSPLPNGQQSPPSRAPTPPSRVPTPPAFDPRKTVRPDYGGARPKTPRTYSQQPVGKTSDGSPPDGSPKDNQLQMLFGDREVTTKQPSPSYSSSRQAVFTQPSPLGVSKSRSNQGKTLFENKKGKPELLTVTERDITSLSSSPVKRETFHMDQAQWDKLKEYLDGPGEDDNQAQDEALNMPPRRCYLNFLYNLFG